MANALIDLISTKTNIAAENKPKGSDNTSSDSFSALLDSAKSGYAEAGTSVSVADKSSDKKSSLTAEKSSSSASDSKNKTESNLKVKQKNQDKNTVSEKESSSNKSVEDVVNEDVQTVQNQTSQETDNNNQAIDQLSDSVVNNVAEVLTNESLQPVQITKDFLDAVKSLLNSPDAELAKMAKDFLDSQPQIQQNVDLVDSESVNEASSQISIIKNQVQNLQTISNIKIQPDKSVSNEKNTNQAVPIAQPEKVANNATSDVVAQDVLPDNAVEEIVTPVIKVSENIAVQVKDAVQTLKDNTHAQKISQKVLDETKAEITSITQVSSNASNTDTPEQNLGGNAQEQAIKLSLTTSQQGASSQIETLQSDFSKSLDSVQNQTAQSKEVNQSQIMSQIHARLNTMHEEGSTKITILLKPENLGKINLELVSTKEGLMAQMTTDNPQVKEALDKSLDGLKESLGSQGINVNSVSVKVETAKEGQDSAFNFTGGSDKNNQGQGQQKRQDGDFSIALNDDDFLADVENEAIENNINQKISINEIDYKI